MIKKADRLYGLPEGEGAETLWPRMEKTLASLRTAQEGGRPAEVRKQYADMLWLLSELAYRERLAPEQILADKIAEKVELLEPESE